MSYQIYIVLLQYNTIISIISGENKKSGKYTLDQIEVESFRDSEEETGRHSDLSEPEVGLSPHIIPGRTM